MTSRRAPPKAPLPSVDPTLKGPGNFTGVFKNERGTFTFQRPTHEPLDDKGRPTLRESDHVVQTACKLFNRDGYWPGWFLWMVTNNVPERFRKEAARLAVQKAKEDEDLRGIVAERAPAGNRQAVPRRRP